MAATKQKSTFFSLLALVCVVLGTSRATGFQPVGQLQEPHRGTAAPPVLPARAVTTPNSTPTLARLRKPLVRATSSSTTVSVSKKTTSSGTKRPTSTTSASTTSRKTTAPATTRKVTSTTTRKTTSTTAKLTTATTVKTSTKPSATSSKVTTTTGAPTSTATTFAKKKGISYNTESFTSLLGKNVSWAYNWYSAPQGSLSSSIDFAPMLWSNGTDKIQVWAKNVAAAKARGDSHLLGFNEPDLQWQANMTIPQAVAAWKQYMEPYHSDFKLVSPAVTNGGSPMGVAWLDNFIKSCTGCHIDAVALHWYDQAWNTGYFTNYLSDAMKTFSPRPIWLTEFRGSGTAAEQITFINTVVPWMNKQTGIERYALFGLFEGSAAEGNMITNGQLNAVGRAYSAAA